MTASALLDQVELPLRPTRGPRSGLRAACPAPGAAGRTSVRPGPGRRPLRLLVGGPRPAPAPPAVTSAPAPAPRLATRHRSVRLTRRGRRLARLLVLAAAVGALLVGVSIGRVSTGAATQRPAAVPVHRVTVAPGETLWQLAERVAPRSDPRAVVAQLERLNRLPGPVISPGQSLVVPS